MPQPGLVVLDTSVVSMLLRGGAEAEPYRCEITGLRAVISFQTLEEMWFGAIKGGWGTYRRNRLSLHLDQFAVVWPTPEMAEISANLRSDREKAGRRLHTADAWIAATAIMLNCPLASHDRDFGKIPNLQFIHYPSVTS